MAKQYLPSSTLVILSAVYTTDASTILPNSGKYVTLIAPDVRKGFQNDGDMYLRGDHSFMDRLDVHPSLNAIVHCNRSAISKDFFFSLGFEATDITPIRQQSLTTAKEGANLNVLGECRVKMTLTSPGNRTKWTFNPIIVRSLAMDCNLSGSYLMRNKWEHLYSRHALLIQGTEVPLVQAPVTQQSVSAVYTTDASTILPNSGKYVTLIAPDVRKGFQNDGDMYLRGDHSFMDRLDVHPSLNAIVHCNR
jgi:hypothetical protein